MQHFKKILSIEQFNELSLFVLANEKYYMDESIMTDEDFDSLREKLLSYNVDELSKFINERLYINNEMKIVDTTTEMVSLEKLKSKDKDFDKKLMDFFLLSEGSNKDVFAAPKFDGCALKITQNTTTHEIEKIITRGGVDVTEKFKQHKDIKNACLQHKNNKHIAGELLIKKQTFIDLYSHEYKNPRNFVSKLMKQDFIERSVVDSLSFVALSDGKNILQTDEYYWSNITALNLNIENLIEYFEKLISFYRSDSFPFLVDGIVLAFDEDGERKIKNNYPLNMVALKFPNETAQTKVKSFEWTICKSGNITPVLQLEPVQLLGCTVSQATGYNYSWCKNRKIGIGSIVEITKSGDIIPIVLNVITESDEMNLPDCEFLITNVNLVAKNSLESTIYKFNSALRLLQIEGIGDTLAEKIGRIVNYDIVELFNDAHKADICQVLGGGKIFKNFCEFYNIKTLYLDQLINLLQFNSVGSELSKRLALLILGKSTDKKNIAEKVLTFIESEGKQKIKDAIRQLKEYDVSVISPIEISSETITFEMTGEPPLMTKADFVKKFKERNPNSQHITLTKNTKYLFCDSMSSSSSKMNKARKYNIEIITYNEALTRKF